MTLPTSWLSSHFGLLVDLSSRKRGIRACHLFSSRQLLYFREPVERRSLLESVTELRFLSRAVEDRDERVPADPATSRVLFFVEDLSERDL